MLSCSNNLNSTHRTYWPKWKLGTNHFQTILICYRSNTLNANLRANTPLWFPQSSFPFSLFYITIDHSSGLYKHSQLPPLLHTVLWNHSITTYKHITRPSLLLSKKEMRNWNEWSLSSFCDIAVSSYWILFNYTRLYEFG